MFIALHIDCKFQLMSWIQHLIILRESSDHNFYPWFLIKSSFEQVLSPLMTARVILWVKIDYSGFWNAIN